MSKTNCQIAFTLEDVTAKADSTLAVNEKQSWVEPIQIHDELHKVVEYATCESDQFKLDGTLTLPPDDMTSGFPGWWSQSMSDENGVFAQPPVLISTFTKPHSSIGISLISCAETSDYPSKVRIQWFDANGSTMADEMFYPNAGVYFCDCQIEDYYKLILTFYGTNKPYRFLKLYRILYGATKLLGNDQLLSAQIVEEISPLSDTVSINTLNLQFHSNGEYDLLDLRGVYKLFQQRQRLVVREQIDAETLEMGTYFLSEPSTEGDLVTLAATDWIGVIENTNYVGGLWLNGITAADLMLDIMTSAGTQNYYELDESLHDIVVTGYLPVCTHREALQQLAFAIGAIVSCARGDQIKLYPKPTTPTHIIAPDDKVYGHKLTQTALVTGVEVYVHNYSLRNDTSEVFKETCRAGTRRVTFSAPCKDLSCSGAVIVKSGVNYADIEIAQEREVVITGFSYDEQTSLAGAVYMQTLPASAVTSVLTIEDCTLMADAQGMAQRIYDQYQERIKDEGQLLPVLAAVGDCVEVTQVSGRTYKGVMTSMDIDLTGGYLTNAVIQGA